jgi:uncharacterized protein (DUF362 family)
MKRRDFFRASLLGAAGFQALRMYPFSGYAQAAQAAPLVDPTLAIVKGQDIAATVRAAVDALGGIKSFVKAGDVVFLKPNMSFPNPPEWGSTTHPDVIRAVVQLCEEAGARRIIAADFPMRRAERCLEKSGMTALAADMPQLTFAQLGEEKDFVTIAAPDATEFKEIAVAKLLQKADVFINLPSAKAHSGTSVSMGLKNLMGLIYDRRSFHGEYDLHAAVADLGKLIRPRLTILDAHYALLTNGPGGPGRSEQLGVRMAEWNNRMSDPSDIRHLAIAAERGAGSLTTPEEQIFRSNLG